MKILYVITGLGLGGAEKVVVDLADQMTERGHEVTISYLKGPALVKPKSDKVRLHYLGLESIKNFFFASQKYKKLIKKFKPDIVHAHMVHANIFARLNRIGCRIPKLICTAHNSNEGGQLRMLAYRFTNFLSNYNTNVSKEATASFIAKKAFTSDNLHTVYNGINLSTFQKAEIAIEKDTFNCIAVGRFNEQKDYPNLLNAIPEVIEKIPNFHLDIAGEGDLKEEMIKLSEKLNIENFISFLGRRDDIPELMNNADLFILPSKYEGFGLVVAEAMACSTFVVATDCGGVKEVMGGNGILVPPKNSAELAKAILIALSLPQNKIEANNNQALLHVQQNFDLQKIVTQWEEIYAKQ